MRMSAWSILPVTQVLSISFRNALFLLRLRWNLCSHVGRRSVNTVFIWSMKCGRRNKIYAHQHVLATCARFYAGISADCWSPLLRWPVCQTLTWRLLYRIPPSFMIMYCYINAVTESGRRSIDWHRRQGALRLLLAECRSLDDNFIIIIITSHEHAHYENTHWQQCISDCDCQSQREGGWMGLKL